MDAARAAGEPRRAERVLIAHNRYVSALPSGENRVVAQQAELLADAGLTVELFTADSDDLAELGPVARARYGAAPIVGSNRLRRLDELIGRFRPDVVHLHNPYPLLSPRVVPVAHRHGVPVVQTVHNYRHRCMNGLLFRDGATCTSCEGRLGPLPGMIRGCYRQSRPQSMVMGVTLAVHRRTWPRLDRFVAVSPFVAQRLRQWGVPAGAIRVVANPVPGPPDTTEPGSGLLFAGRLGVEKGIDLLLDAWQAAGVGERHELALAGSGPLESQVRARVATMSGVRLLGQVSQAEVAAWRERTRGAVISSGCFEALPTAAGESYAHGRPVVTIDHGVQGMVVDEAVGWVQPPSVAGLAAGLRAALTASPAELAAKGAAARQRWHDLYRPAVVIEQLRAVYDELVAARH
jgi:glycosyltransferase involved in cell wall biosynthesis